MDANDMRQSLDRFYEGQASEAEEQALREFARRGTLPEEGENEFLDSLYACPEIPEGLEQRLGKQIDSWNTVEKSAMRRTRTISMKWIAGIAAALLVMLVIVVAMDSTPGERQYARKDTYDNAQDAYAQTQKALLEMSESLNKGLDKMEEITK